MLSILKEKDKNIVDNLFKENGLPISEFSLAITAKCCDEILGYCLFDLDEEKIIIHKVEPQNDIMLSDGILRSALHIAAERSIMNAFYSDFAPKDLFKKLLFIKNEAEKSLDIDKLFSDCGCKHN